MIEFARVYDGKHCKLISPGNSWVVKSDSGATVVLDTPKQRHEFQVPPGRVIHVDENRLWTSDTEHEDHLSLFEFESAPSTPTKLGCKHCSPKDPGWYVGLQERRRCEYCNSEGT